jgi:hypothetical protein
MARTFIDSVTKVNYYRHPYDDFGQPTTPRNPPQNLTKTRPLSQVIHRELYGEKWLVAGTHQKKVFFGVQNNSRLVVADRYTGTYPVGI